MLVFSAGAYTLTTYAYNFNKQRETETALREHGIILSMIEARISGVEKYNFDVATNKERLAAVMKPVADYYRRQGGLFALYSGEEEVFSDIPDMDIKLIELGNAQDKNKQVAAIGAKRHVLVASKVPDYPHLTFVYARDISQIDNFQKDASRVFIIINVLVLVLIGVSVYLLLRHMTRPITSLGRASAEIAGGAYDKRVCINSGDEFEQLGRSFNMMADSVGENIARLARSAEEKQEFIDDLSHEIRTPLTSVLGYAEYLQNARIGEEERITATENLYQAALQIKNLSGKLLELTSLRNDRNEDLELGSVMVQSLFDDLVNLLQPSISARGLSLKTYSDIGHIRGDKTLLLSMLTNLVENSARASKPGDVITVKAYETQRPAGEVIDTEPNVVKVIGTEKDMGAGFITNGWKGQNVVEVDDTKDGMDAGHIAKAVKRFNVVEVIDTGYGMDIRETRKITAPFYRVEKSRSRKDGGTGLGLSIVSQIAALHEADLEIESQPGEGTVVRICFTTR